MKSMLYLSSAAAFSWSSHFISTRSLHGFSSALWARKIWNAGIEGLKLDFALANCRVCCYSAKTAPATPLPKLDTGASSKEGCNAFYIVRKGDLVGVYKTLKDCQSLVCDPLVKVYKGYSICKDAEEYLLSRGLKNATYSISSLDVTDDLFGTLVPFTDQQSDGLLFSSSKDFGGTSKLKMPKKRIPLESDTKPNGPVSSVGKASRTTSKQKKPKEVVKSDCSIEPDGPCASVKASGKTSKQKRSKEVIVFDSNKESDGLSPSLGKASKTTLKQKKPIEASKLDCNTVSCFLEFDGASKGNPGKGGAGAILRSEDGNVVCKLREGLGVVTNNVAEYRAIILGMKCALKKGFSRIQVQGDSQLIIKQILNQMKTTSPNLTNLNMEAKELKKKFLSFQINHVRRELNKEADALANLAAKLDSGEVQGY